MSSLISYNKHTGSFSKERRPLMLLKDYLLEDLSSCSSNGFKSFPRKKRHQTRPSISSCINSTLQRALAAVITTVKLITFPSSSVKSSSPFNTKKGILVLPRGFSRKLFKLGFWRKSERSTVFHVEQCNSFDNILTSFSNNNNSNSCLGDGQLTNRIEECSNLGEVNGIGLSVTVGEGDFVTCSEIMRSTKKWPGEDKEQSSPVSVLDCPFEEEEITSPFNCSPIHFEGTKKKQVGKIKRFESLTTPKPLDLGKRFAQAESIKGLHQSNDTIEQENLTEKNANELVRLIKAEMPRDKTIPKVDNLLLDFFREQMVENPFEAELNFVRDWISGNNEEMFMGWEKKQGRHVYLREMEKKRVWKTLDEEIEEVTLELELDAFNSLLGEVLVDFL